MAEPPKILHDLTSAQIASDKNRGALRVPTVTQSPDGFFVCTVHTSAGE